MKVWCPYLFYHLGCFGRKKYVQKEWRNDKTPTWDISQKGLKRSTSSSSVHENDKFRTNNREVWRIVSFVSSFGSFTADVIWGSPSSSDCSKAFSTTSTFLDIRCFYAPSLVGSWRGRIFRSLIPSSVIIGRNLSSKRLYLGNLDANPRRVDKSSIKPSLGGQCLKVGLVSNKTKTSRGPIWLGRNLNICESAYRSLFLFKMSP